MSRWCFFMENESVISLRVRSNGQTKYRAVQIIIIPFSLSSGCLDYNSVGCDSTVLPSTVLWWWSIRLKMKRDPSTCRVCCDTFFSICRFSFLCYHPWPHRNLFFLYIYIFFSLSLSCLAFIKTWITAVLYSCTILRYPRHRVSRSIKTMSTL